MTSFMTSYDSATASKTDRTRDCFSEMGTEVYPKCVVSPFRYGAVSAVDDDVELLVLLALALALLVAVLAVF